MRKVKVILLLLLAVFFASCQSKDEINKIEKIDKVEYKENSKNYNYDIVIPQISNVQSEDISYFNLSLQENARLIIDEVLETSAEVKNSMPSEAIMNYLIKENDFGIVSIVVKTYIYTGGAHGNTTIETYNIDKKELKLISFENFFNEDAKSYLEMKINDIIESNKKVENLDGGEVIFFENAEVNIDSAAIYFEGDDVKFVFPLYELAPYSSGMPMFSFSKKELKKYIR